MGYVSENLMPGEQIVFETKLHWVIFLWPAVFALLGMVMYAGAAPDVGSFWIALAVVFGAIALVRGLTSEFAVTDRRVIGKVGVISRRTVEMQIGKVESLGIDQGLLGRALGYGTVRIRGTGSGEQVFKSVDSALALRSALYQQLEQAPAAARQ